MLKYFFAAITVFLFIYGWYIIQFWYKPSGLVTSNQQVIDPPKKAIFTPKTPTLERIFSQDHYLNLPEDKIRVLIATGDIIPARSVNYQEIILNNFKWPYEKVVDVLKKADLRFANLETPLIFGCQPTQEGMVFCGDPKNIEGLKFSGVDVANLANNHAGNYGKAGVLETVQYLSEADILTAGLSGPVFKDIKGLKFAFLGYNDVGVAGGGLAQADEEKIKEDILEAKSSADIVIVAFHWGVEYMSQPSQRQKDLAHLAIDSGADLIIGNHPHWIQPVEIYQDKIITYAHGNFIFDQMWSQKTRVGVVGRYTFFDKKLINVEFLPVQIDNYGQPHFLSGKQKEDILNEMKQESIKLAKASD